MELSDKERERLRLEKAREESEKARAEHEQRKESFLSIEEAKKRKKTKRYMVLGSAAGVIVLLILAVSIVRSLQPGPYDSFAKCLAEKGAVMYGADFCKFTQGQRAMFGKSFKYINYQDFTKNSEVKVTPTWFINSEKYENAQSFERLAALTGCELPK